MEVVSNLSCTVYNDMVQHPPSLITTIESKFSTRICFDDLLKFVARTCTIANLAISFPGYEILVAPLIAY
jgi:hypothetical protein